MPAHHHRSWPTTTGRAVAEVGLPDPGLRASGDHPARARGPHGGPASRLGRSLRTRAALPEPTGAGRLPANAGTHPPHAHAPGPRGRPPPHPGWVPRYEPVRPYPNQLERVAYRQTTAPTPERSTSRDPAASPPPA